MNGIKALIAEDDIGIREVEGERIRALGHDYDGAGSAKEVYDLLAAGHYHYILMDMQMPMCPDGVAIDNAGELCLREIRKRYTRDELPVIIVTGVEMYKRDVSKATGLMFTLANDFLVKPALEGEHTLEEAIRACIGQTGRTVAAQPRQGEIWLRRELQATTTTWRVTTPAGTPRRLTTGNRRKANLLLDCIFTHYRVSDFIDHETIASDCGWHEYEYFKTGEKPGEAVLKNLLTRLKKELGIGHERLPTGFRFFPIDN